MDMYAVWVRAKGLAHATERRLNSHGFDDPLADRMAAKIWGYAECISMLEDRSVTQVWHEITGL